MTTASITILWVFPTFGRTWSGLSAPVRRFVELAPLLGDNYDHLICALDKDWSAASELPDAFAWTKVDAPVRGGGGVSLRNMWSIRKLLTETRPTVLATCNWDSADWLMVNRGPGAIPHMHFEDPLPRDSDGRPTLLDDDAGRDWGRRRAFPGRDRAFIAPCGKVAAAFTSRWGAQEETVHTLPPSVSIERFTKIERRLGGEKVVFGALAPMVDARRHDRLLRVVATLRERGRQAEALVIGDGAKKESITAMVAEMGLSDAVSFGERYDLEAALARMDVFAITSDAEPVSQSLPVAMAAGLPIVATDVADVREAVDPLNAMFVRPAPDESALAAAAELLAADPELRLALGEANRRRAAESRDHGAAAEKLDMLLRRVSGASWRLLLPAPETTGAAADKNEGAAAAA